MSQLIRLVEGAEMARPDGPAWIAYDSLPDDMQTLIFQFVEDYDANARVPRRLPLGTIPVSGLPHVPLDPSDRGEAYALAIDPRTASPVIVADGWFLDGKHRVFSARAKGIPWLAAIDLTGIAPAIAVRDNAMGPALGFVRNTGRTRRG